MTPPPPALATLRLIVTAMIIGACIFGGTVLFSASRMGGRILAEPMIGYVLVAVAILDLIAVFFIMPARMPKPPTDANEQTLLKKFGLQLLIRIAVLEAALMLCFVFYLITQDDVILAIGIVLTLAMLMLRPGAESYRRWRDSFSEPEA